MKIKLILAIVAFGACLTTFATASVAQTSSRYQQMTEVQRNEFVAEQARRIAQQMSGREYEFTPAFTAAIERAVDAYARRIGNNGGQAYETGDARFIFQRGQTVAPVLVRIFRAHNLSPLIGLYIPLVESEYINLQSPNSMGALGMFQFLPQTGARYGLSPNDLLDVEKSADAAARYIEGGLKKFEHDPMKEALALLAYNRGTGNVERDVATFVNDQNRACSICALTEQTGKMDAMFQKENVYYVPRFFAAAIMGENPETFGLQTSALSSLSQ
jgi:membrane-bound lytic murein transglycosylase B